jgi:flagellar basal body rod protein FlgB
VGTFRGMKLTSSAVVLVLLAAAGCGGSDNSFTDEYNEAVRPLSRLEQGMGSQPREFDRLARRTEATRQNLAKLDPPDDAQDEFDAFMALLDRVTADLKAVATAARRHDVADQREAARQLVRSSTKVQQAETALKAAVEG